MLTSLRSRNIMLMVIIVLAGQLLSLGLIWILVIRPQVERIGSVMARNVAAISEMMDRLPEQQRSVMIAKINQQKGFRIIRGEGTPPNDRGVPTLIEAIFIKAFARELAANNPVVWRSSVNGQLWVRRVSLGGEPYWISSERPQGWTPNGAMLASFLTAVSLALIAGILLQRRIAAPLQTLADAADSLQLDAQMPPLPTDGPDEIASVSRSFNNMRDRLAAQETERNIMLAGISHDLRTPLAKIRLALALQPSRDTETDAMLNRQLDLVDHMLGQFLDYARGHTTEIATEVDVAALMREIGTQTDAHLVLNVHSDMPIVSRPIALSRVFTNLVRNALLYGRPPITVQLEKKDGHILITISDQGDGVSPELMATMDKPFVRGDQARPSDGGTGLGLAIVRQIVASLGGTLELRNGTQGGFDAVVKLPAA